MASWWNGRHRGLKSLCHPGVPVRVRVGLLTYLTLKNERAALGSTPITSRFINGRDDNPNVRFTLLSFEEI